jgi:cellulose biosynthesis protein BcsQ
MTSIGTIISFYSFKGGVGRSMALANIAALLCKSGKRVLAIDWDLEAPGLNKFFEQRDKELRRSITTIPGMVELLCSETNKKDLEWTDCVIKINISDNLHIDLISAGRATPDYGQRVQSINWQYLYEKGDLGEKLEKMRSEWKSSYDYILLDSRTGVTDIGDVCTAMLPDILITVLIANEQSIEGTKYVIERARTVHGRLPRDRTKLIVVPIIGRDESFTEYELSASWRARLGHELEFTLADWLPRSIDAQKYFQKIFIPYYSYWSFGENLPVVQQEDELENPASISAAYGRIASLIQSNLDWSALEQGINSAEVDLLRSKALRGEAKSAEYALRSVRLRRRVLVGAGAALALVGAGFVSMYVVYKSHVKEVQLQAAAANAEIEAKKSQEERKALETELTSSKALVEEAMANAKRIQQQFDDMRSRDEQQRASLEAQIAELQQQNRSLLSVLERSNAQTQQKLDELIQRPLPQGNTR